MSLTVLSFILTYRTRHAIESRAFVSIKLPDKRTRRRARPSRRYASSRSPRYRWRLSIPPFRCLHRNYRLSGAKSPLHVTPRCTRIIFSIRHYRYYIRLPLPLTFSTVNIIHFSASSTCLLNRSAKPIGENVFYYAYITSTLVQRMIIIHSERQKRRTHDSRIAETRVRRVTHGDYV